MHAHHGSLASPEGTASEERPRVLLAEDDPELRTLISLSLRWDGYVVVEAADGTEALECFGGSLLSTCAPRAFDLIVSADTLVYFGPLDAVVGAAAAGLRPGGRLIFTVEEWVNGTGEFCLNPHGRYTHARTYVERVLADANLRPEIAAADLRTEGGVPVAGLVVRATKGSGEG